MQVLVIQKWYNNGSCSWLRYREFNCHIGVIQGYFGLVQLFFYHAFHYIICVFRLHLQLYFVTLILHVGGSQILLIFIFFTNFRQSIIAVPFVYFGGRHSVHLYLVIFLVLFSICDFYNNIANLILMLVVCLSILVYPHNLWVSRYSWVGLHFRGECRWFWVLACYAVAHPCV